MSKSTVEINKLRNIEKLYSDIIGRAYKVLYPKGENEIQSTKPSMNIV